jgi:hypothetical protein
MCTEFIPKDFSKRLKEQLGINIKAAKVFNNGKDIPKLSDTEAELLLSGGLSFLDYLNKNNLSIKQYLEEVSKQ